MSLNDIQKIGRATRDVSSKPEVKLYDHQLDAVEYINAAETPEDRRLRKIEKFGIRYGGLNMGKTQMMAEITGKVEAIFNSEKAYDVYQEAAKSMGSFTQAMGRLQRRWDGRKVPFNQTRKERRKRAQLKRVRPHL